MVEFDAAMPRIAVFLITFALMGGCSHTVRPDPLIEMNRIAESYVRLVLAVGEHDPDYVDAYYGPEELRREARSEKKSLNAIKRIASALLEDLEKIEVAELEEIIQLRHQYLTKQLQAMIAKVEILGGKKMSFDEEARALYDATPPIYQEEHFKKILTQLERLLPGDGSVAQRYEEFRKAFIIPTEKLDAVFSAAIAECRKRTNQHLDLPPEENFKVEYVSDKSWSGYNWYQGNSYSLIQVNTDLPIYIDRAIDLACHEGYPGHHVYNVLLEENLVKQRNWIEFSIYPLFSPQSLIAEGSANYGIEIAFPGEERVTFERDVLFPLAGLDSSRAERYYRIAELAGKLNYAQNEAARRYLNGLLNRDETARWLKTYALVPLERARQRVRFIDQYRSYVINYNLGQDLVRNFIESRVGTRDNPDERWKEFKRLLSSPRLPSGLLELTTDD